MPSNVSLQMLKQEPRLVSITASHMSRFMRSIVPSRVMPALLTTISIGPMLGDDLLDRRLAGVEVADIEFHHRDAVLVAERGGRGIIAGIDWR